VGSDSFVLVVDEDFAKKVKEELIERDLVMRDDLLRASLAR